MVHTMNNNGTVVRSFTYFLIIAKYIYSSVWRFTQNILQNILTMKHKQCC